MAERNTIRYSMYALLKILRTFLRLIQVYAVIVIVANAARYCFVHIPLVIITASFIEFVLNVIPQTRIRNLSNKAVLITGCDTGLGNALARTLDSIGFRVFAACLKANSPGADSLKSNCSEKLTVIQLDVTKDDDVEAARRVVEDSLKNSGDVLWGVVNNSGIAIFGEVEWLSVGMYQEVLDVNLLGMIRVTKQFLPLLRESKGRIVNASSIQGRFASPFSSSYCISKFGVEAFGDSLRYEMYKWGIKVVTIEPGNFASASAQFQPDTFRSGMEKVWNEMPTDIQELYGKKYVDAVTDSVVRTPQIGYSNPSIVMDDYVKALTLENPSARYLPSGLAWKMLCNVLYFSPSWVGDLFFKATWLMWKRNRPGPIE